VKWFLQILMGEVALFVGSTVRALRSVLFGNGRAIDELVPGERLALCADNECSLHNPASG
jgi:hypothetical protein